MHLNLLKTYPGHPKIKTREIPNILIKHNEGGFKALRFFFIFFSFFGIAILPIALYINNNNKKSLNNKEINKKSNAIKTVI